MNTVKNMPLTQENFAETISKMLDVLTESKFTATEINLTNLLVEETFFALEEGVTNNTSPVKLSIYDRLGETRISLRLKGNSYNPLIVTVGESDDEIFSARQAILNANLDKISYTYKNSENIITIVARRISGKKKKLLYTVLAMTLGICAGFSMQTLLPTETIQSINLGADIIRKIFLQLLNMLVAPVTFFSILSGLSQMSDSMMQEESVADSL